MSNNLRRKLSFWTVITCLLAIGTLAFGQITKGEGTGAEKTNYFNVDLDGQWVEIPYEALSTKLEQVLLQTGQTVQYLTGYASTSGNNWFELPYIIVTSNENRKWSQNELDKLISETTKEIKESLEQPSDALPPTQVGEIRYEKRRRIIWVDMVSDVPQVGKVHSITASMLTEIGTLNFILCVAPSDRETRLREFSDLLNRVTLDPALVYRPGPVETLKIVERSMTDALDRSRSRDFSTASSCCVLYFLHLHIENLKIIEKRLLKPN